MTAGEARPAGLAKRAAKRAATAPASTAAKRSATATAPASTAASATGRATAAGASPAAKVVREISDPRTMRAFAHPVRIALIEALRRVGPLTATRAAEILDDTPGNMSWHLQTLARYGFVEEAGGGRGRSRPWRLVVRTYNFETAFGDPESAAAGEALEANVHEHSYRRLREWWSQRRSYPVKWRRAAFSTDAITYLTAEETTRLNNDVNELILRYRAGATDKDHRPPGALPVHFVAFAHPLPPTPSGN